MTVKQAVDIANYLNLTIEEFRNFGEKALIQNYKNKCELMEVKNIIDNLEKYTTKDDKINYLNKKLLDAHRNENIGLSSRWHSMNIEDLLFIIQDKADLKELENNIDFMINKVSEKNKKIEEEMEKIKNDLNIMKKKC